MRDLEIEVVHFLLVLGHAELVRDLAVLLLVLEGFSEGELAKRDLFFKRILVVVGELGLLLPFELEVLVVGRQLGKYCQGKV